ncbi:hypothetical protein LAUMK191_00044 [Mycobacterium attenuatum]|uniref:hypothetical protein n=1 Tax=Mycobacterium attenuatum TaxID=2341086 RepID=UPI000F18C1A7|nr:hypothetical protein [Mycobacterium attenuatum]VBA44655.1 hypothetical protein LAUMK191_00044 [Mycobacterium attenuatum]
MSKDIKAAKFIDASTVECDVVLFNRSKAAETTAKQRRKIGVAVATLGALTLCSGSAAANTVHLGRFNVGRLDIALTAYDGFKLDTCSNGDFSSTDGSGSGGNSDSVSPSGSGGNLNEINSGSDNPRPEQVQVFIYSDYNPNDTSYDPNSIPRPQIEQSYNEAPNFDVLAPDPTISSVDPSRLMEVGVPEVYFEREPDSFDAGYANGSVHDSDSEQVNPFSTQSIVREDPGAGELLQEYFVVTTDGGLFPRNSIRPGADIDDLGQNWYNEVVSNSENSRWTMHAVYDPERLDLLRDFVRERPNQPQWTASDEERYSPENIDNFARPNYNDPRFRDDDSSEGD